MPLSLILKGKHALENKPALCKTVEAYTYPALQGAAFLYVLYQQAAVFWYTKPKGRERYLQTGGYKY